MCLVVDGSCDVWDEREVRARKVHRCRLCGCAIAVGVVHHRIGALSEGRWWTTRVHLDCHELAKDLQLEVCGQDLYTLDLDLREEVREHLDYDNDLLPRWREVLRARRAEGVWPVRRAA